MRLPSDAMIQAKASHSLMFRWTSRDEAHRFRCAPAQPAGHV